MKKQLFLLLAAGTLLVACGNEGQANEGNDDKSYVVGIDETFAPMSFRNAEGDIVGFDVDLAAEVGEIMGVEFTFQPIDWVMKETELNAGNIDLIWNGYSITDERKEKVAFTDPYLDNRQIIVTLADSGIQEKADLTGVVVSTQQASATLDALNADTTGIVEKFDGGEPILYPTFTDVFNDLDSKRSEAIVVDEVLGRYIMGQKGADKYRVLEDNFGEEQYGVGVRKDDTEFLADLNEALKELKNNGSYDEIYAEWFAE